MIYNLFYLVLVDYFYSLVSSLENLKIKFLSNQDCDVPKNSNEIILFNVDLVIFSNNFMKRKIEFAVLIYKGLFI